MDMTRDQRQVHKINDQLMHLDIEIMQEALTTVNDTRQVVGDIVKVRRPTVGRIQGAPVQTAPVAMLRDEHVAQGGRHVVGGTHQGNGERLQAVGTVNAVAVMAVTQGQVALVKIDQQRAGLEGCRIAPHAGGTHAAHHHSRRCRRGNHFLSGLGILKTRFQRMPPSKSL